MAVDQGIPHVPGLREPYHGVVDGSIAVGVVLTHYFAHYPGGLFMGLVRCDAKGIHPVEYPSVDRLKAVPYIRKGARYDYRHGVVYVRLLHLVVDLVLY